MHSPRRKHLSTLTNKTQPNKRPNAPSTNVSTKVHHLHVPIVNQPTPVTGNDVAWTLCAHDKVVAMVWHGGARISAPGSTLGDVVAQCITRWDICGHPHGSPGSRRQPLALGPWRWHQEAPGGSGTVTMWEASERRLTERGC